MTDFFGSLAAAARSAPWPVWVAALALASSPAAAQTGDEFASSSNPGRPFQRIPEQYPDCADLVHEFWSRTDEIEAIAERRAHSVNPEAMQLGREINAAAKERSEVSDQILDCVKESVIKARPPLQGGVEQSVFELEADKNQKVEPEGVVLRPGVPELDPREVSTDTPGPEGSPTGPYAKQQVRGKLLPPRSPGGSSSTGSHTEATVRGKILPRAPAGGGGGSPDPGGGGGSPDPGGGRGGEPATYVETDVRGEILGSRQPGEGGTVANDFTRRYFFAQGMLTGVEDAGETLGGRLGQLMVAGYYLVTLRPQDASAWLGLQPGQSITLTELGNDIRGVVDMVAGDPQGNDLNHSYESGRFAGKKLTELFIGKFGKSFRNELDWTRPPKEPGFPQMPSRWPGTPPLQPPAANAPGNDASVTTPR